MQPAADQDRLIREGAQALGQGRAAEARARFQQAAAMDAANPLAWLLLAIACRHTRDPAAEETALDRPLALDPQSLPGLIMKADCRAHAGSRAEAIGFYRAALGLAETVGIPPDDAEEVERARTAL